MKRTPIIALVALTLILTACSSFSLAEDITPPPGSNVQAPLATQAPPAGPSYPLMPPNPVSGAPIYLEKCAPCHGQTGLGDGPQASQLPNPPVALGAAQVARESTPSNWYNLVTQGNLERFMPPFTSLTERQRWDVVAYAYTLSVSPEALSQGEQLYQENCAGCHGPDGEGTAPQAADLSSEPVNFTDQAYMSEKSGADLFEAISSGIGADMPAYADQLSSDERWALADYLRSLTFSAARAGEPSAEQASAAATSQTSGDATQAADAGTPVGELTGSTTGSVSGTVINASGGETPDDLRITLHGFDNMEETLTLSTTVQSDGSYLFPEVEMPAGRAFISSTEYGQAIYGSDVAVAEEGKDNVDLPLPIYESTTDPSVLSVDRLHIFFEYVEPDTLRVVELFIISNLSNRTLVAPQEGDPVVTYQLPSGAENLQFEDGALGDRFTQTASGFGDNAVIRPGSGQHQVVVSFDLPYQRRLEIAQPITLPVNAVVILVPEDGPQVSSSMLQDAGERPVQGVSYRMYTSDRLEAGRELDLTISGRGRSVLAGLTTGSQGSLIVGLAAFGLALIGAGVWFYRRSQAGSGAELSEQAEVERAIIGDTLSDDPDTLMDAIIALDDLYQAGDLPEAAYRQRRAELKNRLAELVDDEAEG